MQVTPLVNIEFARLRAAFPMQDKAPFGYTDFLGEYANAGFPRFDIGGDDLYSGNDQVVSDGDQGGVEFDPVSRCCYARHLFVMHDNVMQTTNYGGVTTNPTTGPFGNPTVLWSDFTASSSSVTATGTGQTPPGYEKVRVRASGDGSVGSFWLRAVPGAASGCQGFTAVLLPYAAATTRAQNPYLSLRWRIVGSDRGKIRWYAVSLHVGGEAVVGTNDQTDADGNPVEGGWTPIDLLKSGAGRADMLAPGTMGTMPSADSSGSGTSSTGSTGGGGGTTTANTYSGTITQTGGQIGTQTGTGGGTTTGTGTSTGTGTTSTTATSGGSGSSSSSAPPQPPQILEVRVIGGQMRLLLGAEDTPYQWPHPQSDDDGIPDWFIDRWQIVGNDLVGADFSVHLTKFLASAATISQDINTGVALDDGQIGSTAWRVHYAPTHTLAADGSVAPADVGGVVDPTQIGFHPPNCTASAAFYDVAEGTILRYRLAWDAPVAGTYRGVAYSDYTAAVRAVTLDIPGTVFQLYDPPTILGSGTLYGTPAAPPLPQRIEVSNDFDLSNLTISSRAEMTWNNFQGNWTNAAGTGYLDERGHFAATVEMGIAGFDSGLRTEFTGIANTGFSNNWGGQGRDTVTMFCRDLWAMLGEPCWNLPWMDGWNVYYALSYLAAIGTITRGQLAFAGFVPDDAYSPSPGLDPSENYYLPVGVAGTPMTRFGNGQKIRDAMLKIANSIGFTLFFDVTGQLQFYKFAANTFGSGGVVKAFQEVAGSSSSAGGPGLDEVWSGSYRSSLDEVRNSVTVMGTNLLAGLDTPLVSHDRDEASIYDDSRPNYVGWSRPLVWTDSLFAVQGFADSAVSNLLAYLRIPDKSVSFQTWLPGDRGVFPGDLIQVRYSRSAASLYTYFVVGTRATIENGQPASLTIQARLVPPEVLTLD